MRLLNSKDIQLKKDNEEHISYLNPIVQDLVKKIKADMERLSISHFTELYNDKS